MIVRNQPRVLALVGMPGAGKTMCAAYLADRGFFQFRFGGIVTDEVARRQIALNPQNEQLVREEIRANEGMDAIARRALPLLRDALSRHNSIVIDGLYSFSEYKTLQPAFAGEMIVVAVTAPRHVRYARLSQRPERPLTAEEAERRDFQEIENLEKGGPIAIADFTLVNAGDPTALFAELDKLLASLSFRP